MRFKIGVVDLVRMHTFAESAKVMSVPLGKLGCKIITNGFRSTRLLRQKRFEKISFQANWAESDSGKPGQRCRCAS
jgi:hypothetical protein